MIASRESQYKILHFHHAGLDKLAEVFQQWKCCRETQLKDQVGWIQVGLCGPTGGGQYNQRNGSESDLMNSFRGSAAVTDVFLCMCQVSEEKSCMQFSIQRSTLLSADSHPEERLYRRLDVTTWLHHLNHSGQVEEEYKLRKVKLTP